MTSRLSRRIAAKALLETGATPFSAVEPGRQARFARTVGPASGAAAQPSAAFPPFHVYDPPVMRSAPPTPPLPPNGVTDQIEARSVDVEWPSSAGLLLLKEVQVYTTTRRWGALDVYLADPSLIGPGMLLTIRVYAIAAQSPPVLVATGRVGHFALAPGGAGEAMTRPLWVCAARAQADRYVVTHQVEATTPAGLPGASGQTSSVTVVASNVSDDAPPWLGTIRLGVTASTSVLRTPLDAELLEIQGIVGEAVATPRYLHVYQRPVADSPFAGKVPEFCFPLGAGVGAGGGFGGSWRFAPGMRPQGPNNFWHILASTTALTTTQAGDCLFQAVLR